MKNIVMFYFSGTGNTKYAMDKLSINMTSLGWDSKAISIEKTNPEETQRLIEVSDVVIMAYPIYGSDLPDIMHDFINYLKPVQDKKLGVICTQLLFSGDGSSVEKKKLKQLGFQIMWGYQINMLNNLTTKGSPFRHSKGYEENKEKLAKVDQKLIKIARTINEGKKRVGDDTIINFILGLSQRPAYRAKVKHSFSHNFACSDSKCVKCQKCLRNCPKKVIEFHDGKIIFKNSDACTGCFRCYNFCPMDAILYKGVTKSPLYKGPTKEIYKELFK